MRTVHLKSNVYLYVDKGATIKAIKGADAPEATWFSDKKYRSGLSPTDTGPYADPENYMTKQDVGHHYSETQCSLGKGSIM
jgi:polygalacturonase